MRPALHHVELWTTDLTSSEGAWDWLLKGIGWGHRDAWPGARTWSHPDGSYLVLEQSPDVKDAPHDRLRAGLNHLAFTCSGVDVLDALRAEASEHGWNELFADKYPHAGGPTHTALFLESDQGFEVEVVAS
jgi:hypothetical protein